jgi:hypothetical protein
MRRNSGHGVARTIFLVCALTPTLALAANININDLTDTITVQNSQFEGGFTSSVAGEDATFSGSWISNGGTTGSGIVYLLEPGTQLVSDSLTVNFGCTSPTGCVATISGAFASDTTGNLGPLPAGFTGLVENGTLQNVTGAFQDPVTHAAVAIPQNLTILIASDIAESPEVPEPSSIYLVVSGIAALLLGSRRKAKRG